jgi:1-acyl-sn-glycerol-3-phosphate acyltransferase
VTSAVWTPDDNNYRTRRLGRLWDRFTRRDTVFAVTYWVLKAVLSPIFYFFWRIDVVGRENIPKSGPVILAPNHTSFCDSFFLPLVLRRRVTFVAKAEYFDSWKTAWFFRAAGQIPMHRQGGSASERALAAARDVLSEGGVLGIYPEGTRSPDGRLYRGHTGVARLALQCAAPVVPVGMTGTTEIQPIGSRMMRPFKKVRVAFGAPLKLGHGADSSADPLVLRRIADELMFEIRGLTGQDYVNRYAKRHDVVGGTETASIAPLPAVHPEGLTGLLATAIEADMAVAASPTAPGSAA